MGPVHPCPQRTPSPRTSGGGGKDPRLKHPVTSCRPRETRTRPRGLWPHQREAVDTVLHALEPPARTLVPERGLRTQVVMATGSGKTRVAVRSAEELHAGRVLVLVPSTDLLAQTETAWREGGRRGPMF
ncbi:DEAD/DEAH box helicase [Streptomyces sp. NRRL F-2747]|uniref:DEAD/DEAH box helicase n=1 Tax=Streptomyces sp. NRRL F-2747 TaxID=1463843 RepID=UPI003B63C27A